MADLNLVLTLLGSVILLLSLGAGILRSRGYLPSEVFLATCIGVAVGPVGVDLVRVSQWGPPLVLIEEAARVTVAIAVTDIALQLPVGYVRTRGQSLVLLVGPGMGIMWLASSLVTFFSLAVPFGTALLVGAIVTPTDPVVATSIVDGRTAEENIPERIRHLLVGEAGLNDGIALAFVLFAIAIAGHADGTLTEVGVSVLWEVSAAVALGLVAGSAVGGLERKFYEWERLDETPLFTVTIALTFTVLGVSGLLDIDGILGVFVAGLAYNWQADESINTRAETAEAVFSRVFTLPIFVLFGAVLPWAEWLTLGWRALVLVGGILLFRRLPMVLALRNTLPPLDSQAATLFVGWFGPIGVAGMFYATLAMARTGSTQAWTLGSLVVAGSIVGHGLTASAATLLYGNLTERD